MPKVSSDSFKAAMTPAFTHATSLIATCLVHALFPRSALITHKECSELLPRQALEKGESLMIILLLGVRHSFPAQYR